MNSFKYVILRVLAVLAAIALISSVFVVSATVDGVESEQGYTLVASSGNLNLYLNSQNTFFYVENKLDGSKWYSNPTKETDMYASGITMSELKASIFAVCHNSGVMGGSTVETLNSYSSSVLNDSFVINKIKNGFEVEYTFDDDVLVLPLRVALEKDGLVVSIPTSKIKIRENISIEEISVLPYFGCGTMTESGYLVVPDGSGGIINFNNGKSSSGVFSKRIYGEDITDDETTVADINDPTRATLPIFGIKKNGSAILASIEKGSAFATVEARTNGSISENANIFASFKLYTNMQYTLSTSVTTIFEKKQGKRSDIEIKYFFLSGDDADYSGMAIRYKQLLKEKGILTENKDITSAPYLSVYGGIVTKRSYFGFLVDTVIPMTTTDEILEIVNELEKAGVKNPIVNYKNWSEQELKKKATTSLSISKKIEGKIKFHELYENEKFEFYPMISNTLSYTKQSFPFQNFFYRTTDISGIGIFKQDVSKTTMKEQGKRIYYLNFKSTDKFLNKLIKSIGKKKVGAVAFSDIGNMLYEDFSKESVKRDKFEQLLSSKLEKISKKTKVLLDNPNMYALKYTREVVNIPVMTDGQQIIDQEIPFVQIVLDGCIRYASNSLNYIDENEALLKAVETGSMPHYFVYYGKESQLKSSEYSDLCFGNYKVVIPKLAKVYKAVCDVRQKTKGSAIVSHSAVSDSVYSTEYSNGVVVYVNYSDEDYITDSGLKIESGGFNVKEVNE